MVAILYLPTCCHVIVLVSLSCLCSVTIPREEWVGLQSGKPGTILESNQASGVSKTHYA